MAALAVAAAGGSPEAQDAAAIAVHVADLRLLASRITAPALDAARVAVANAAEPTHHRADAARLLILVEQAGQAVRHHDERIGRYAAEIMRSVGPQIVTAFATTILDNPALAIRHILKSIQSTREAEGLDALDLPSLRAGPPILGKGELFTALLTAAADPSPPPLSLTLKMYIVALLAAVPGALTATQVLNTVLDLLPPGTPDTIARHAGAQTRFGRRAFLLARQATAITNATGNPF